MRTMGIRTVKWFHHIRYQISARVEIPLQGFWLPMHHTLPQTTRLLCSDNSRPIWDQWHTNCSNMINSKIEDGRRDKAQFYTQTLDISKFFFSWIAVLTACFTSARHSKSFIIWLCLAFDLTSTTLPTQEPLLQMERTIHSFQRLPTSFSL